MVFASVADLGCLSDDRAFQGLAMHLGEGLIGIGEARIAFNGRQLSGIADDENLSARRQQVIAHRLIAHAAFVDQEHATAQGVRRMLFVEQ